MTQAEDIMNQALAEGDTISGEKGVGLRGQAGARKKKNGAWKKLMRLIRRTKVQKPTPEEQAIIDERLARMYPKKDDRKPVSAGWGMTGGEEFQKEYGKYFKKR
jgi:hypothetical protein